MASNKLITLSILITSMVTCVYGGLGSDILGAVGLAGCLTVCHTCCVACLAAAGFTGSFNGGSMTGAAPTQLPQSPAIAACLATFQSCELTCRTMY